MRREFLIEQINSLLALDRDGVLRPHGLGGLARELLSRSVTALTNPVDDWTVDDTETAGEILTLLGIGCDASKEPGADWRRDKIAKMIRSRISQQDAELERLRLELAEAEKKFETADKLRVFWNDKATELSEFIRAKAEETRT